MLCIHPKTIGRFPDDPIRQCRSLLLRAHICNQVWLRIRSIRCRQACQRCGGRRRRTRFSIILRYRADAPLLGFLNATALEVFESESAFDAQTVSVESNDLAIAAEGFEIGIDGATSRVRARTKVRVLVVVAEDVKEGLVAPFEAADGTGRDRCG